MTENITVPRNCVFCEHFEIDYEYDLSEVTPGAGLTLICREYTEASWELSNFSQYNESAEIQFRDVVMKAASECEKFSQINRTKEDENQK